MDVGAAKQHKKPYREILPVTTTPRLSVNKESLFDEASMRRIERETTMHRPETAIEFRDRVLASEQVAVCVIDSGNHFVMVSPRVAAVTGYSADELKGRTSTFLIVPEDEPRIRDLVDGVLTQGKTLTQVETNIICKSGSRKTIRFEMGPIRLGIEIAGAVATVEDTSRAQSAEEAMQRT